MNRDKVLMAKIDKENYEWWLPLWMHLKDTACIMGKLVKMWLPDSAIKATQLEYEEFCKVAVFLAGIHDIGKATSYFQSLITKNCATMYETISDAGYPLHNTFTMKGKTPHAFAGQWILSCHFNIDTSIADVVGAHHGRTYEHLAENGKVDDLGNLYPMNIWGKECDKDVEKLWIDTWKNIIDFALEISEIECISDLPVLTTEAQVLLAGLLIVADWLASNVSYFPLIHEYDIYENINYKIRVDTAWQKIALSEIWNSEVAFMDEELFNERFNFYPNEVQKNMIDAVNENSCPGIFVLEAQMGVGKTEAALAAVEVIASKKGSGGIYIGMPTQTTSNGIFPRLCKWAVKVSEQTKNSIMLAHSAAEFNDYYNSIITNPKCLVDDIEDGDSGIVVHPWFQGRKKALLADFVIGTVDQFLMASLNRKHFMLRHLGLVGKVVIIDECHAYDAYMNQYLDRTVEWMAAYGVPVIMLSATLPFTRRRELVERYVKSYSKCYLQKSRPELIVSNKEWYKNKNYPLLTYSDGESIKQKEIVQNVQPKTVQISYTKSYESMITELDEVLCEGGCACIIVNTVKVAQEIYNCINEKMENVNILLYHAQFIMPERAQKEKNLLEHMGKDSVYGDRYRYILIGTQVLEQSLDYDADIMFTQLCPIDLMLQRIGRLHRHGRLDRPDKLKQPRCIVLTDGEEMYDDGTKSVYGDYLLKRTNKILNDYINIPYDISNLIQGVYEKNETGGDLSKEYNDYIEKIDIKTKKAKKYLLKKPRKNIFDTLSVNDEQSDDIAAQASVRDGESSIEVILMKRGKDGKIHFLQECGDALYSSTVPNDKEGRMIAKQRIRLPHCFCTEWMIDKTITELEKQNKSYLPDWQISPWIKGELILLLDNNNHAELNGYILTYNFELGLQYEKKEEKDNGRKGI